MLTTDNPEFEVFQAALRGVTVRYVLRARPERNWHLSRADFAGVGLMAGREGAPNVCTGAASAGFFNAFIALGEGEPFVVDGHRLAGGDVAWMAPGCAFHSASSQPASWLRVTMSRAAVQSWFACHADEADPELLSRNGIRTSSRPATELIRLAQGVLQVDAELPERLHGTARERSASLELLDAALRSVVPVSDAGRQSRRSVHAAHIMERALAFIETRTEPQVHIDDLCRATGVSERTLRNVFYRNFGMSPHQYLMVARLHDVRAAIRGAGPGAKVSGICADFGIWDFGRFAGHYRRLFGVLPSQELAARRRDTLPARFPRAATCRSSVLRGYSPNNA